MKKYITLTLFSATMLVLRAQYPLFSLPVPESSGIREPSLKKYRIEQVVVDTYKGSYSEKSKPQSSIIYTYDSNGKLKTSEERQNPATPSKVNQFEYSANGELAKTVTTDMVIKRGYQTGYRFNSNHTVFQAKSYEVLNNNQKLLLGTRQYVYENEDVLSEIRWIENGKVLRSQQFVYDEKNNVKEERFLDGTGTTTQTVSYLYDDQNRPTYVGIREKNQPLKEFTYQYDFRSNPSRIEWKEGGISRGLVTYEYNGNGLPLLVNRIISQGSATPVVSTHVYQYHYF